MIDPVNLVGKSLEEVECDVECEAAWITSGPSARRLAFRKNRPRGLAYPYHEIDLTGAPDLTHEFDFNIGRLKPNRLSKKGRFGET